VKAAGRERKLEGWRGATSEDVSAACVARKKNKKGHKKKTNNQNRCVRKAVKCYGD
jgi:hypothetical protein